MDVFSQLLGSTDGDSRFFGVAFAIVTNNKDPDGLGRVKVKLPWMAEAAESDWARVMSPMAGPERGFYFLPEVDDEVLVAFEHGNPESLYVLGALWNGKDKPPVANSDGKNDVRVVKSRSGHLIRLTDTKDAEKIEIVDRTGKNSIVISSKDNTLTITSDADLTIKSANGKLTLGGKGVEITSTAAVKVEASQNMDLKAGPQLNVKGQTVNIN
jgi:phage baseplate assembly protein V